MADPITTKTVTTTVTTMPDGTEREIVVTSIVERFVNEIDESTRTRQTTTTTTETRQLATV